MDSLKLSHHLKSNKVKIDDGFWNKIISLVQREVIPYQYKALCDKVEGAEKSHSIENFIKAAKIKSVIEAGGQVPVYPVDKWFYDEYNSDSNAFKGWVFQDSDVYKWLEAVGYSLGIKQNDNLKKKADEIIEAVCSAQLESGYLDTLYIINDLSKKFTNLKDFHELYCFGHLAEAAVAYYNGTGEKRLLEAACKFADLICETFNESNLKGYPGHEIAELALVKLYRETGKKQYLDTAEFFITQRGKAPYYYDIETGRSTDGSDYIYNQAHKEPRLQDEAVGHAVRGVYLYTGMAELAGEINNDELLSACKKIWNNIVTKKLYITGGIGSTADGEAFSFDYDLPNDLAYCETCASVGLIFFARSMNELNSNSVYADIAEKALYNCVLAGMAEDGKSFFYVNPLEVLPEASRRDSRKKHVKPVRQKWFSCACCPPNLARLICSLSEYIYTENDNTVFINQLIGNYAEADKCSLHLKSDYIKSGHIDIEITNIKTDKLKIAVRMPNYCENAKANMCYSYADGYMYFDITEECIITVDFEIKPQIIKCSNRVRENCGKVAVTRGPFVYALEEVDNGNNLQMLTLDAEKPLIYNEANGTITASGYREEPDEELYKAYSPASKEKTDLTFIPYFKWGNRGENEMEVYIRLEK